MAEESRGSPTPTPPEYPVELLEKDAANLHSMAVSEFEEARKHQQNAVKLIQDAIAGVSVRGGAP